ncbi:hypothetical protein B0H16DRAFT_1711141 [Mycena metata]|uniref:F-box domain-containing protein n=1 Tax=Mycena metata TaxID=1033252 RepID=A0AAD7NY84_9AGAR|nr:hypothetical protein B0H16DRAFT_1711141 [Mycena metata]
MHHLPCVVSTRSYLGALSPLPLPQRVTPPRSLSLLPPTFTPPACLPQELIDAILEDAPDSSLGACSMTTRAFVATSQRRLFRWMSLVGITQYERTDRLFEDSPHLARYIRHVTLNIGDIPHDYGTLSRILDRLYSVERVSISGTNTAITSQLSVLDFLARPSIKCLALDALLDVLSSLLSGAFKYFEQVVLSKLNTIQVEEDPDAPDAVATLAHRIPPVPHAPLSRIPPVPQLTWAGSFSTLLRACSPTLKHLELELEADVDVTLPVLPQVDVLVLWLETELARTADLLTAIVSTLPPPPPTSPPSRSPLLTAPTPRPLAGLERPRGPSQTLTPGSLTSSICTTCIWS